MSVLRSGSVQFRRKLVLLAFVLYTPFGVRVARAVLDSLEFTPASERQEWRAPDGDDAARQGNRFV